MSLFKVIVNTPELWWSFTALGCVLIILYILIVKIKGQELIKAMLVLAILGIVCSSIWAQVILREQVLPVYVDLPEEWPLIDTNGTDTLIVSLSPNKDTLYTSFLIKGFTDLEVEQEVEDRHNRWLQQKSEYERH